MALSEWRLNPEQPQKRASKAGWTQVILPFIGGVIITFGALANDPILIGLYIPFQVIGIIIYLVRLGPKMLAVPWLSGGPARHYAVSAVFLVANVALITTMIVSLITGAYGNPPDFSKIPFWMVFAMDHAMFIGVMTNGLFGLVSEASGARRSPWPWADHVIFWGMNVGLVGFVVGLMLQSAPIKQVFAPIMGISILIAIVTYLLRLRAAPETATAS
jgi:predicted membrane protein